MKNIDQHTWNLITRVLSGEACASEREKFTEWLEADPKNRKFFEKLKSSWQEEPDNNAVYHSFLFDRESGTSRLRYKMREEDKNVRSSDLSKPQKSHRFSGWKIAASILLVIGILSLWAGMRFWSPPMTSYKTGNLEQRIITLPDGSGVRLNKNSEISLKEGFAGTTRKVTLKGEAFFQVTHNISKPFIVHAGNAVIRDIGTSFNVKQQQDGKVVVAMKEGKAALRANDSNDSYESILTRNQIGILNKNKINTIEHGGVQNYLSWIEGRLEFSNMRFDDVIQQLDNIYGTHSSLSDSSLSALELTAFTNNNSLDEVLSMIAVSLDIRYRRDGNHIVWAAKKKTPQGQQKLMDTTVNKD